MIVSDLELVLRDGLAHLYDPGFQPSEKLCELFGCEGSDIAMIAQTKIVRGIEALKPGEDVPPSSRTARLYEILHSRFVLRLTLEETAMRLHMSLSSTWREQRSAIHFLASEFWRQHQRVLQEEEPSGPREGEPQAANPAPSQIDSQKQQSDWQSQTKRELAALQSHAPDVISNVGKLVQQVCELETSLAAKRDVRLEIGQIKPDLEAALHPNVLRQILITAIGEFLKHMSGGKISLFARLEDGGILVTLAASITSGEIHFKEALLSNLPLPEDTSAEIHQDGTSVFVWVRLPSVIDRLNVLVLDDNLDMIHFYQRSTEGTNYRIVAFEWGDGLTEAIQRVKPDLIILDVMLPSIDGWDLLMQIHADPSTRQIPVIVCSVVKGEELALSLGAALYLSKPVPPQDFIKALDSVLAQTP